MLKIFEAGQPITFGDEELSMILEDIKLGWWKRLKMWLTGFWYGLYKW